MAQQGDMLAQIEEIIRAYNRFEVPAVNAMEKIADVMSERLFSPDG